MPGDHLALYLSLLPAMYFSLFLHEAGHAVLGWWYGYEVTSFGLGLGQPLFLVHWRGTRIYFSLTHSTQGITWLIAPVMYPPRYRQILMLLGGCLANGVAALIALLFRLLLPWGGDVWLVLLGWNAWIGLWSLVPFQMRLGKFSFRSDGSKALQLLCHGHLPSHVEESIRTFTAMRPFWEGIGDLRILRVFQAVAAMAWTALGDCKYATELCAEADRLSVGHSSQSRALWALARACALETGQPQDCAAALDEAEAIFSSRADDGGQFLVSWLRALLLVRRGDAATALARLEALQNHPVVARHADLRASLLESRLQAAAELSDEARIEQLRGHYELLRVKYPSLVRDLTVYRTLARVYVKRSDWSKAERAYRQAILAAQHLRGSLLAQDRERFLRCQEPLLQEAAACLQHAGKEGEAEELRQLFAGPKGLKRARLLAREYWSRQYYRSGLALGLMNLICGLAAVILAFVAWPSPPRLEGRDVQAFILVAGVILSAAGVVAGGCWAAFRLLERPTPAVRGAGGPLTLVLGAVPWVVLLLLALTRR